MNHVDRHFLHIKRKTLYWPMRNINNGKIVILQSFNLYNYSNFKDVFSSGSILVQLSL